MLPGAMKRQRMKRILGLSIKQWLRWPLGRPFARRLLSIVSRIDALLKPIVDVSTQSNRTSPELEAKSKIKVLRDSSF